MKTRPSRMVWVGFAVLGLTVAACGGHGRGSVPDDTPDSDSDTEGDYDPCDRDADGHDSLECGGDDCNDSDSMVYPGAADNDEWAFETVAEDWAELGSLAIDSGGTVHIAYQDKGTPSHASNEGGAWETERIDAHGSIGACGSMAIDAAGAVHVGYTAGDSDHFELRHATNASGVWVFESVYEWVDGGGPSGWSLALAPDGAVHVTYLVDDWVFHASNETGAWVSTRLAHGYGSSLVVDGKGRVRIAYRDLGDNLVLATTRAGSWLGEVVDELRTVVGETSLALDANGAAHIAYKYDFWSLAYATNAGGEWVLEAVDPAAEVFEPWLAVGAGGDAHIGYLDRASDEVRHATNAGGEWAIDVVGNPFGAHPRVCLAVDAAGVVHAAYFAEDHRFRLTGLRHARNDGRVPPDGIDQDCDGEDG